MESKLSTESRDGPESKKPNGNLSEGAESSELDCASQLVNPPSVRTKLRPPSYLQLQGDTGLHPSTKPFDLKVVKRLDADFDDTVTEIFEDEKLKIFLRIRPSDPCRRARVKPEHKVLHMKDDKTIIARPNPKYASKVLGRGRMKEIEFKFSKIFGPLCGQSVVFEDCVTPLVDRFLRNESCLIFTYGATNSGKTYTLQGHGKDYGIIPRTLDKIFAQIHDRVFRSGEIQPIQYQGFRHLRPEEIEVLERRKEKILADAADIKSELVNLRANISSTNSHFSSQSGSNVSLIGAGDFHEMNYAIFANTTLYSVWVSFAELYNERVYDLLENVHIGKGKTHRRKELKLVQDSNGYAYIKDLTELHVTSENEAYKIFLAGKKNLQFAATQMNERSSRSHSFFTLRTVCIGIGAGSMPYPKSVHRMTFCDLAGMERAYQTENEGSRLKESGNINNSLTVLLKVIRILREKQLNGSQMLETIPFRESKLTHIFKSYFTSSTHVCMLVNVSSDSEMYDSTIQVLHNSAIASNIVVFRPVEVVQINRPVVKKNPAKVPEHKYKAKQSRHGTRKNQAFDTSSSSNDGKINNDSENSDSDQDQKVLTVVASNKLLQQRLLFLENQNQELKMQIRQYELEKEQQRDQFLKLLAEQNRLWSNRMQEVVSREENITDRRMSLARQQLSLSPGSKCGMYNAPPVSEMEMIIESTEVNSDEEHQSGTCDGGTY